MDLVNEDGTPVLGQVGVSSSSAKASVDLRLQFVEAPKKRVQVLGLLALLVQKYTYCGCSLWRRFRRAWYSGTLCTCFTGTKVQILTQQRVQELETEVESLRQLFVTTKDKLSGREQVLSLLASLVQKYKY
jgi:hypothetical protein